jgi:hypothetical protein
MLDARPAYRPTVKLRNLPMTTHLRLRRAPLAAAVLMSLALLPAIAAADAVTEWNTIGTNATAGPPLPQNRAMAMMHIAIHDALNAIDGRYAFYNTQPAAPGGSPDAAVAAAAYTTLQALYPAQAAALKLRYDNRIEELPACPAASPNCVATGVAAGVAAANAILALRANDGSATPHLPYTQAPGIGVWQPTPPQSAAAQFAGYGQLVPFAMASPSQFRPGTITILDVDTMAYARDFNEVKTQGNATVRSASANSDKSRAARFWPGGGANLNGVARVITAGYALDPWQNAQYFALLNIAANDAGVAIFDAKYNYNFWRPTTAIRAAADDGNSATQPDPGFTSYIATPPYPDYPCGLPGIVAAGNEVTRRFLGTDNIPYTFSAGGITRYYKTLSEADADAVDARVYGGIHFRSSCEAGSQLGAKVADFVFATQLLQR